MKHTVLVVDDDAPLRELMCDALEMSGYSAVGAGNGQEALDAMQNTDQICLVLLDLLMPVMDGWDVYRVMKANSTLSEVPVVVHTSEPSQAPDGARVLQKPVKLDRLLSIVHEYCPSGATA